MELTKRQMWLIDYLVEQNKKDPKRWITLEEIVDAMNCDLSYCEGDNYQINDGPRSHNPCPALWFDKEAINENPEVEYPVIYDNYCVKIPSSMEELKKYYTDPIEARAKKMLWRIGLVKNKARKDGQMKIEIGEDGKPTEHFIEAMIRLGAEDLTRGGIR